MSQPQGELDLLDFAEAIKKRRFLILKVTVALTCLALLLAALRSDVYRSHAKLIPLGKTMPMSGLASIASQFGLGGSSAQQNSARNLINVLSSRTLQERVQRRLTEEIPLLEKEYASFREERAKAGHDDIDPFDFKEEISDWEIDLFDDSNTGLLNVYLDTGNAFFSKRVLDTVLSELQKYIDEHSLSDSKRDRAFIGQRLLEVRRDLLEVSKELADYYSEHRVSAVNSTVDINIREGIDEEQEPESSKGRGGFGGKERRESLRSELEDLTRQKEQLDSKIKAGTVSGVPQQIYLEYLTLQRNLISKINGLLLEEYEWVKIEESRQNVSFHVLDDGLVEQERYRPNLKRVFTLSLVLSTFFGVLFAVFLEYVERLKRLRKGVP